MTTSCLQEITCKETNNRGIDIEVRGSLPFGLQVQRLSEIRLVFALQGTSPGPAGW